MFKLDEILERWAEIYTPMKHNPAASAKPENKTFFRIDRMELENGFTRNFNVLKRPSLCFCANIDARLSDNNPRLALYHYQLYVCQRQGGDYIHDDDGAADTKYDINDIVLDLISFLFAMQDAAKGKNFPKDAPQSVKDLFASLSQEDIKGLDGMQLDASQWWSVPRFKNGWWIIGLELFGLSSRPLCFSPSKYQ